MSDYHFNLQREGKESVIKALVVLRNRLNCLELSSLDAVMAKLHTKFAQIIRCADETGGTSNEVQRRLNQWFYDYSSIVLRVNGQEIPIAALMRRQGVGVPEIECFEDQRISELVEAKLQHVINSLPITFQSEIQGFLVPDVPLLSRYNRNIEQAISEFKQSKSNISVFASNRIGVLIGDNTPLGQVRGGLGLSKLIAALRLVTQCQPQSQCISKLQAFLKENKAFIVADLQRHIKEIQQIITAMRDDNSASQQFALSFQQLNAEIQFCSKVKQALEGFLISPQNYIQPDKSACDSRDTSQKSMNGDRSFCHIIAPEQSEVVISGVRDLCKAIKVLQVPGKVLPMGVTTSFTSGGIRHIRGEAIDAWSMRPYRRSGHHEWGRDTKLNGSFVSGDVKKSLTKAVREAQQAAGIDGKKVTKEEEKCIDYLLTDKCGKNSIVPVLERIFQDYPLMIDGHRFLEKMEAESSLDWSTSVTNSQVVFEFNVDIAVKMFAIDEGDSAMHLTRSQELSILDSDSLGTYLSTPRDKNNQPVIFTVHVVGELSFDEENVVRPRVKSVEITPYTNGLSIQRTEKLQQSSAVAQGDRQTEPSASTAAQNGRSEPTSTLSPSPAAASTNPNAVRNRVAQWEQKKDSETRTPATPSSLKKAVGRSQVFQSVQNGTSKPRSMSPPAASTKPNSVKSRAAHWKTYSSSTKKSAPRPRAAAMHSSPLAAAGLKASFKDKLQQTLSPSSPGMGYSG